MSPGYWCMAILEIAFVFYAVFDRSLAKMAKGKGLSPTKRAEIVSMFNNAKLSKRDINRRLGVSIMTSETLC